MSRWLYTLDLGDVFHNDSMPFKQKRDAIARRIRAAGWYDPDTYAIGEVVERIAEAEDAEDFNDAWSEFYDWADVMRVWVKTWGDPASSTASEVAR